ncbi:hypothetical protein DPMN_183004 [Dreissena polymorpha]|uniref:Uncharacterized protein n=1 Tax=Dreissena polymorpha TaxID=45954 RepID=A0A9D4DGS2_DREPO|nr:hypothetical protein DPMN_183004 [Dreissena polymorpha]
MSLDHSYARCFYAYVHTQVVIRLLGQIIEIFNEEKPDVNEITTRSEEAVISSQQRCTCRRARYPEIPEFYPEDLNKQKIHPSGDITTDH